MDLSTFFDLKQFWSVDANPETDYAPLNFFEVWTPTPFHKNVEIVGYGGLGIYLPNLYLLWPSIVFALAFYLLRRMFKKIPVPKSFKLSKKESQKFMYQAWLLTFYTLSSAYGLSVMWGKPWCSFPLGPSQRMHQLLNHPQIDTQKDYQYYYSYSIGFFLAELVAIFVEARRSDFREYLIHHTVTLYLLIFSFLGFEHVPGGYVILIHDLSDIFLCLSKMLHYLRTKEIIINTAFGAFVVSFAFFRLYCLPSITVQFFTLLPKLQSASVNFWLMIAFLQILQGLQVFWFVLIIRMIYRLATGVHGDVRSDNEDDEDAVAGADKPARKRESSKKDVANYTAEGDLRKRKVVQQ